jgi:hypothetical protein
VAILILPVFVVVAVARWVKVHRQRAREAEADRLELDARAHEQRILDEMEADFYRQAPGAPSDLGT